MQEFTSGGQIVSMKEFHIFFHNIRSPFYFIFWVFPPVFTYFSSSFHGLTSTPSKKKKKNETRSSRISLLWQSLPSQTTTSPRSQQNWSDKPSLLTLLLKQHWSALPVLPGGLLLSEIFSAGSARGQPSGLKARWESAEEVRRRLLSFLLCHATRWR